MKFFFIASIRDAWNSFMYCITQNLNSIPISRKKAIALLGLAYERVMTETNKEASERSTV